ASDGKEQQRVTVLRHRPQHVGQEGGQGMVLQNVVKEDLQGPGSQQSCKGRQHQEDHGQGRQLPVWSQVVKYSREIFQRPTSWMTSADTAVAGCALRIAGRQRRAIPWDSRLTNPGRAWDGGGQRIMPRSSAQRSNRASTRAARETPRLQV